MGRPQIAVIGSHRFPGGTSTAVAEELGVLCSLGDVCFYQADVKMLRANPINAALFQSLRKHDIPIKDAKDVISADIAIIHNPSVFKFEHELTFRVLAREVFVVMHENPVNAFNKPNFDFPRILQMLHAASITPHFVIAPISGVSRALIEKAGLPYELSRSDWFNIWSGQMTAPTQAPRNRRGRHSRPGVEKWPRPWLLDKCFPADAENHILGAPPGLGEKLGPRANTYLYDFGSMRVPKFLGLIDFMIYFHSEAWRESFGRTVAEAIAAGKLVITHPYMEATFGKACIYADPDEVDAIVSHFVANPASYAEQVETGQQILMTRNSPETFLREWGQTLTAA